MPNIIVQLVHIQGPLKGQTQDFSRFPVRIGRHASCQVRFDKDLTTISRQHARIERQGNRFRIIDASTNGTYVNGKRIADVYLRDGDMITFSENGPKAGFLLITDAVRAPSPPARPTRPVPLHAPEPGLTLGPDVDIPVISTHAPLVIQFGPALQSFNLLPVTIGTDPACDFVIADDLLAGRHLQIFFNDNDYYVKDLTEKKMVAINGRPVGTQAVLAQGAELSLTGKGPRFRFLGGGRLAEIQYEVSEPLAKTDADPTLQGSDNGVQTADKKNGKTFSMLKKLFK